MSYQTCSPPALRFIWVNVFKNFWKVYSSVLKEDLHLACLKACGFKNIHMGAQMNTHISPLSYSVKNTSEENPIGFWGTFFFSWNAQAYNQMWPISASMWSIFQFCPSPNCLTASIPTLTLFKCWLCWGIRNPFKAKSSLSESIFFKIKLTYYLIAPKTTKGNKMAIKLKA